MNCTAEKIHPSLIFTGLPGQSKKVNDLTYVMRRMAENIQNTFKQTSDTTKVDMNSDKPLWII